MIRSSQYTDARILQRQAAMMAAEGYTSENFPRASATAAAPTINGTVYYCPIGLLAGDVVTSIGFEVTTPGAAATGVGMKVGIYTPVTLTTATKVAESGDVQANFAAGNLKFGALTAPYTVPTTGGYYFAIIWNNGTQVQLARASSLVSGAPAAGSFLQMRHSEAGKTDLPATSASGSSNSFSIWTCWI